MSEGYLRDGREPVPVKESTSRSMRSNKGRDTRPELVLRKALCEAGLGGYRLQWKVPGRPDIAYPGRKVAVFVNGCFWHRCPVCNLPLPKSNVDFWRTKFERNVERDSRNIASLESDGWTVVPSGNVRSGRTSRPSYSVSDSPSGNIPSPGIMQI